MQSGEVVGGKYQLVRLIGEGGMGAVWAANNRLIGRDVAIKVMLPEIAKNEDALRRFFNEARICGSIRDPGIVDVLDLGTAEDGSPFIVMELLRGESLDDLLQKDGRIGPFELLPIIRDVAQTLALAHDKGVVHRDLKPANLFLHRGHKGAIEVKILDFGISKIVNDAASPYMTRTGAVLGSPAYMSPEQAAGKNVDQVSDIYSLGVILFEGLTGHIPFFEQPNTNALLFAIASEDTPPLGSELPALPGFICEIVDRALRRDAKSRFGSAREMAASLDDAIRKLATISYGTSPAALLVRHPSIETLVSQGAIDARTKLRLPTHMPAFTGAQPVFDARALAEAVGRGQRPLNAAITHGPVSSTSPGFQRQGSSKVALLVAGAGATVLALASALFLIYHFKVVTPDSAYSSRNSERESAPSVSSGVGTTQGSSNLAASSAPVVAPAESASADASIASPPPAISNSAAASTKAPVKHAHPSATGTAKKPSAYDSFK